MSTVGDERSEQLVAAVRQAGTLLLSLWPGQYGDTTGLNVTEKSDGSLVSVADMRSNEALTTALRRLYPDDCIFSEEVASSPETIKAAHRVWIIDPLDGTAAFLAGRDDFSVLVGLSIGHAPERGIIYLPARDQMLVAEVGRGAFQNGTRVQVSSEERARPARVYVRNFSSMAPHLESSMMDSGLALTLVASGELDGAIIKMRTHREWDIAAPMAVLREAGATVTDERGRGIPLGVGEIGFDYFVASNGRVHHELLAIIPK